MAYFVEDEDEVGADGVGVVDGHEFELDGHGEFLADLELLEKGDFFGGELGSDYLDVFEEAGDEGGNLCNTIVLHLVTKSLCCSLVTPLSLLTSLLHAQYPVRPPRL